MSEPRPLNWGFLGSARINQKTIPLVRESSDQHLYAVASRDSLKASQYAKEWGFEKSYGSYAELIADPQVDVVYNSLPNHLHLEWTLKAIERGKHVLCEKPLALGAGDVKRIRQAAERAGVCVEEAFMYRHYPHIRKIKELVASGALGRPQKMHASFHFPLTDATNIRWDPALGGGSIWDLGCYAVNLMRFMASREAESICGASRKTETGVDTFFVGQLNFGQDLHGSFDCGFTAPRTEHFELIGTKAILRIQSPFRVPHPYDPKADHVITLDFEKGREEIRIPNPENPCLTQIKDFARAIRTKNAPLVTLADSQGNAATIEALVQSSETGQVQRISSL